MREITKEELYEFIERTICNIELDGVHFSQIENLENELTDELYKFIKEKVNRR